MIGRFFYCSQIAQDCITIEMQWQGEKQVGLLHVPPDVLEMLEETDYSGIRTGETLLLPLSLGLGVVLAALTLVDLRIGGDRTAWLTEWGPLEEIEPADQASPSHAPEDHDRSKYDG
jgi:hypothetical protein